VILNLQNVDGDLSRRMVDFCSGLTYAMDGNIQSVANRVFLLTPRDVEVSAEERKRIAERAFFNQTLGSEGGFAEGRDHRGRQDRRLPPGRLAESGDFDLSASDVHQEQLASTRR
jgi:hypothetical protein